MKMPTVRELSRRMEPVTADPFLGSLPQAARTAHPLGRPSAVAALSSGMIAPGTRGAPGRSRLFDDVEVPGHRAGRSRSCCVLDGTVTVPPPSIVPPGNAAQLGSGMRLHAFRS